MKNEYPIHAQELFYMAITDLIQKLSIRFSISIHLGSYFSYSLLSLWNKWSANTVNYTCQCFRLIQTSNSSFTKLFTKKNWLIRCIFLKYRLQWWHYMFLIQQKKFFILGNRSTLVVMYIFDSQKRINSLESFGSESNNTCWVVSLFLHLADKNIFLTIILRQTVFLVHDIRYRLQTHILNCRGIKDSGEAADWVYWKWAESKRYISWFYKQISV